MAAPHLLLVADLVASARGDSAEKFAAALGGPVLVGVPPLGASVEEGWSYHTASSSLVTDQTTGHLVLVHADDRVIPLRKREGGAFANTLMVGRAASNDVIIDHPSVSKLHARIYVATNGTMELADAGSRNGTFFGDDRIVADLRRPLCDGQGLAFGDCSFFFLTPPYMQRLIRTLR